MSATTPTTQKARKTHACDICTVPISVGTVYEKWRWFDGGNARTVKVHPACWALVSEHFNEFDDDTLSEVLTGWMHADDAQAAIDTCEDRAVAAGWQAMLDAHTRKGK